MSMTWKIGKAYVNFPREQVLDALGYIPSFLSEADERPAREQLDTAYAHGGGWNPFFKNPFFSFIFEKDTETIQYPEDPPYHALAYTQLREETIYVFPHAWVLILQPNGDYEISRMD